MQGDAFFLHGVRLYLKKLNLSLEAKLIKVGISLYLQHNAVFNTTGVFKGILVSYCFSHT